MPISSVLLYAMKVYVKWRVVAGAVCTLIILLITYKVLFRSESCTDDYHHSESSAALNEYCNPPHLPATGQEGDVPSSEKPNGYDLTSVHVIIRHGDRTAIHSLPNAQKQPIDCRIQSDLGFSVFGMDKFRQTMIDFNNHMHLRKTPYKNYTTFPDDVICGDATLTPLGVMQHVRNGHFLRDKYTGHRFLESLHFADQILVRGTKYVRTFHSAMAFLYGFLPVVDVNTLKFEMADNNTMCTGQSQYQCWCPAVAKALNVFSCTFRQEPSKIRRGADGAEVFEQVTAVYRQLAAKLGVSEEALPKLSHIFDVGVTHFCNNKRLLTVNGECLELQLIRNMYDAVNAVGQHARKDDEYNRIAKLKMQPLMYEIAHRMYAQATGGTPTKFVLYSGHDSTVDPLASALDIGSGIWPKYASRIVLELYSQSGQSFLRVLMDGSVVTSDMKFCRGRMSNTDLGLCKLEHFLEFVNRESLASIHESDYALACQKLIEI